MRKIRILILTQTIIALLCTEALAVASVFFSSHQWLAPEIMPQASTVSGFVFSFLAATVVLFILLKSFRGRVIFEFLLSIAVFGGVWFLLGAFLPSPWDILFASAVTLLRLFLPYVIVQNGVMIAGVAGISAMLGISTPWKTALMILVLLSIYDVIAVYETKHMVTMFKGLLERGVVFALTVPEKLSGQFHHLRSVNPREGYFFLGSGDLALPSLFVVSAFATHPALGIGAMIGSALGVVLMETLFRLGKGNPMPALPPITLGSLLGFFLAMLFIG
ncbi:MAG: presenilin family intramembrane aspartyl protease [Patescibacteria group bacterium]